MLAFCSSFAQINRPYSPVVLQGNQLSNLIGTNTSDIVAFKFDGSNWIQIPVQIDERALKDIATPWGPAANSYLGTSNTGYQILFYCDTDNYTGADPNPAFDANDELVFLADDMGVDASAAPADPNNVIAGSCFEIEVTDPLTGDIGFIYTFVSDGTLAQDAGVNYVDYAMDSVIDQDYFNSFNLNIATNSEFSTITTSNYERRFTSEWISDQVKMFTGGLSYDILDQNETFFDSPTYCVRSAANFSAMANCMVTNSDGPIRAIRSYMGAATGPLMQRTHLFYPAKEEIITDVRIHSLQAFYDVWDYTWIASGMTYYDDNNLLGLPIDGSFDTGVNENWHDWELVSGPYGSLLINHDVQTDLTTGTDVNLGGYWDDSFSSPKRSCYGDGQAYGTSGIKFDFLPPEICTDPNPNSNCGFSNALFKTLAFIKEVNYDVPNLLVSDALASNDNFNNPLNINTSACAAPCVPPAVSISGLPQVITSASPVSLTGIPSGGTFNGPGVVFNAFNPSIAGPGLHTIRYDYTDNMGCSNFAEEDVLVGTLNYFFVNYNIGTIQPKTLSIDIEVFEDGVYTFGIIDLNGREIEEFDLNLSIGRNKLNHQTSIDLTPGMYLLLNKNDSASLPFKFIVK